MISLRECQIGLTLQTYKRLSSLPKRSPRQMFSVFAERSQFPRLYDDAGILTLNLQTVAVFSQIFTKLWQTIRRDRKMYVNC